MFLLCRTQLIRATNQSTILTIIFWEFTVFPCKFDSPQVKQGLVSSIIKFLYELPDELPNYLKTLEIRKYYENLRTGFGHRLVLSVPPKYRFLAIAVKIHVKAGIKVF